MRLTRARRALLAGVLAVGLGACRVQQVEEGEPPRLEPGTMPEYELEMPELRMEEDTVVRQRPELILPGDTPAGQQVQPQPRAEQGPAAPGAP
jgi:hypothetical protein